MDPDRYELIDVVGNGGMATVWRARDRRLDRLVAVKRPTREADGRRFEREGRLAAGIVHPNVVRVYDVGADDDGPYLVMELVDGPSVADAAPHDASSIGAEIASALAALHVAGVVHGDVKPANILLAGDGARLTDFGVARRSVDAATGPVWATPSYAAPEVAAGGTPTPASDVYSLAIVLHEIVTGVDWSTPGATQPLPTGDWAGILAPALATDPAERPDAATFARSLQRLTPAGMAAPPTVPVDSSAAPPIIPPPARPHASPPPSPIAHRPNRALVGAALLGVLALVVGVAAVAARSGEDVVSTRGPTTAPAASSGAATSATVIAAPATTAPAATTTPATTAAPSTVAVETAMAPSPVDAIAAQFVALVEEQPSNELEPKDARDLLERVGRVVERAAEEREVDKELDGLAKRAADDLSGAARARAQDLVLALADELGVDTDDVEERFEEEDEGDDDDDDD